MDKLALSWEIIRLICSFLGGGLVSALIAWWRDAHSQCRASRLEFVRSQLQELYGPLQFFASCNDRLLKLNDMVDNAYVEEYIKKERSYDPVVANQADDGAKQTLALANEYVRQLRLNNEHILKILESHYYLIDPDDVEIFGQFMTDHVRLTTEVTEAGGRNVPFEVRRQFGNISLIRPEFINRVKERFSGKTAELRRLTNTGTSPGGPPPQARRKWLRMK